MEYKKSTYPIILCIVCFVLIGSLCGCHSPGATPLAVVPDTPKATPTEFIFCACNSPEETTAGHRTNTPQAVATDSILPTSPSSPHTPIPGSAGTPAPFLSGPVLKIPSGTAPVIDGVMVDGEWDNALHMLAGDGSDVLFLEVDNTLYIGIRGSTSEMIVGNIFIAEGDIIHILHTSAALGTAIYEGKDDGWQQNQDFTWRCRSTSNSETAVNERLAFWEDEGWVSTNSRIGTPNELEYQITMPENPFTLAVNILRSSAPKVKVVFPAELDDDVITPTPGGLPEMMQFEPLRWAVVER